MSFQSHGTLTFFDPATLQPIPYSSGSVRTSSTWVNPKYKFGTAALASTHPNAMLTNSTSHGNGHANSTWIPDSGASFHVTGKPQNIKQYTHFDEPDQIFIGNGECLSILLLVPLHLCLLMTLKSLLNFTNYYMFLQ